MAATGTAGTVEVTVHGRVAELVLCREAKLNALSTHLETRLLEALRSPAVRDSRAVVVTGGARVFSAGADTTELREMTPEAIAAYYRSSGAVYEALAALPQPTVAAVAGHCLGGGFELALAADFRIADDSAGFALPEVGIGILPSSGGVTRLVRAIGPARTRDLVLRGRRVAAAEAYAWGLVTEAVPRGAHLKRARELAAELAGQPPLAVALTKQVIGAAAEAPRETGLLLEQLAYAALHRTDNS
ncbi:enoyl-CoA hydratase/isomerase family protein [Streptomyces purpurogeneiscleroticus]|uniref:enoyl-CoA hydratase/isomerase family protein n=1 Tax=Streptomyces purpurogeneiscleroticus TaxID=68259 RepID=UPI001CBAF5AD|nr:enoyl-CoA hydratase/isomerase family protein [Streptomyces purpurogeneiscleroticus]MBZ4018900.1 crotonase [Streptomyces purpurogeneiscleroticus]